VAGHADLGLAPDAKYFNAGVMLMDLRRWREEEIARRSFEYLAQYGDRVYFWDQEALNAVLTGAWGELDGCWNWHPSLDRLEGATRGEPRIAHFSGNLKPWTYQGPGAYHELYYRELDRTSWAGWRPERHWRGRLAGWYEMSPLRRWVYPLERWAMGISRSLTRR
jgi:lipopolysaccharide biosynthesis glycosyltransferase